MAPPCEGASVKPRPEIGSENWLREQLAKGLGPDERDRPNPPSGGGGRGAGGRY